MPRYYRRRYTRVVAAPKKKWASSIVVWNQQAIGTPFVVTLAQNSAQSNNPTPSILKVGNFKVSADLVASYTTSVSTNVVANCFIVFMPEGVSDAQVPNVVTQHPEYILATKVAGSSYGSGSVLSLETLNMSSRLKRNLNSGDRIILAVAFSGSTQPQGMTVTGTVRYWCCAN